MEFNSNKSIYLQICDAICDRILSGDLPGDERIPSVREYGAEIGVNPRCFRYCKIRSSNWGLGNHRKNQSKWLLKN